jgi:hypothetical protein
LSPDSKMTYDNGIRRSVYHCDIPQSLGHPDEPEQQ